MVGTGSDHHAENYFLFLFYFLPVIRVMWTDGRTDGLDDVGNGNGNGSPTYLLPLTCYLLPLTQKKEEKSDSTVVEVVVVSEFNPQNWLTG